MTTEMAPHIKVVRDSDITFREFHITKALTGTSEVEYPFGAMLPYEEHFNFSEKTDDGPSTLGQILVAEIASIPGVIGGIVKKYSIVIKIAEAFDPKEIFSLVLRKIVQCVYPEVIGKIIPISTSVVKNYLKNVDSEEMGGNFKEIMIFRRRSVRIRIEEKSLNIEHLFKKRVRVKIRSKQEKRKVTKLKK